MSPSQIKPALLKSEQMEIRRMKTQDVSQVMTIESVSFGRHHWSEESFYNEINNHIGRYYSLINTTNNQLIGYCGFWLILDEAHVTTIAVHPDLRGNALGELLLLQAFERSYATSIHWLTLEVRASNYHAQNLYYKYGFNSVGLRPRYYQDNQEDALIMTTPDIATENFRKHYSELKNTFQERLLGFPKGFGH